MCTLCIGGTIIQIGGEEGGQEKNLRRKLKKRLCYMHMFSHCAEIIQSGLILTYLPLRGEGEVNICVGNAPIPPEEQGFI